MTDRFAATARLDLRNDLLDVLSPFFVSDHHRVGSFDDDDVLQSDTGHQSGFGEYQAALTVLQQRLTFHGITRIILVADCPQRVPGAYIGPSSRKWHNHPAPHGGRRSEMFHDGIINGIRGTTEERGLVDTH